MLRSQERGRNNKIAQSGSRFFFCTCRKILHFSQRKQRNKPCVDRRHRSTQQEEFSRDALAFSASTTPTASRLKPLPRTGDRAAATSRARSLLQAGPSPPAAIGDHVGQSRSVDQVGKHAHQHEHCQAHMIDVDAAQTSRPDMAAVSVTSRPDMAAVSVLHTVTTSASTQSRDGVLLLVTFPGSPWTALLIQNRSRLIALPIARCPASLGCR